MVAYNFNGTQSVVTPTFNPAVDIVALNVSPANVLQVTQVGANVVLETRTGATLTLSNVSLAALTSTNVVLQGGSFIVGDNAIETLADQFNNTIAANAANTSNILLGLGGSDTISATGNGNNLVFGGAAIGDPSDVGDQITTGTGNDTIYGNGGNDTIVAGGGSDQVFGGAGSDQITLGTTNANQAALVFGGGGAGDPADLADTIIGGVNNGTLTIFGNAGADTISVTSGSGNQSIYGGLGNDTISVGSAGTSVTGASVIYGGEDADTITLFQSATSNATVYGGRGDGDATDGVDNISVTGGNSVVFGNGGDDIINVASSTRSTVYGGLGGDTINVTLAAGATNNAVVYGNNGADTITLTTAAGQSATVYGGDGVAGQADGADTIRGGDGNEVIFGELGDDRLFTGGGSDSLFGGQGADRFVINGTGNKVVGDYVFGTDTVNVTGTIITAANATLTGTTISNGTDTAINFANNSGLVAIGLAADLTTGAATQTAGGTGVIVANLGSTGAVLNGSVGNDALLGGAGADTINGGAGDRILAGGGNDVINLTGTVATGTVTVDGGAGNDTLVLTGGGNGTLASTITNVEVISLTNGAYTVTSADANVANGAVLTVDNSTQSGANTLNFNGSAELDGRFSVTGGAGNDTIVGGAGADTIIGGAGADSITGGAGVDVLTGGAGNDIFAFAFGDGGGTVTTVDTITDLNLGTGVVGGIADRVLVAGGGFTVDATRTVATSGDGTTAATAYVVSSFDQAFEELGTGQAALFKLGGQTYLIFDGGTESTTFDSANDFIIRVNGVQGTLDASDLV